ALLVMAVVSYDFSDLGSFLVTGKDIFLLLCLSGWGLYKLYEWYDMRTWYSGCDIYTDDEAQDIADRRKYEQRQRDEEKARQHKYDEDKWMGRK
ncbi:MAG: hypothetical protein AAFY72_08920, partial [Cyanobacteria bacterium J06649_4]